MDRALIQQILELLYKGAPPGYLNIFTANRENFFLSLQQGWPRLLDAICFMNERGNLWFSPGLRREALKGNKRGTEADIVYSPGVYVDIDVADGRAHKADALPRTKEEALDLLKDAPLYPSLVVDSGHGLQAWWLYDDRDPIASPEDIHRQKLAHKAVNEWLFNEGKARGWRLDKMVPLVGLARLPGTVNLKIKDAPKPVLLLQNTDYQYPLACLAEEFGKTPPPPNIFTPVETVETRTPDAIPPTPVHDERERLRVALAALPGWVSEDYQSWIMVGLALKNHSEINRDLWHSFSRRTPTKYNECEADKTWDSFKPDGKVTLASIYHLADQNDAGWRTRLDYPMVFDPPKDLWQEAAQPWQKMMGATATFPTHILPPVCVEMLNAMTHTFSVPPLMAGMAMLGVASVAMGKNYRMTIKDDHRQWANLYIMIAVPPGIGKSPVLRPLQVPLLDRMNQMLPAYENAMRDYHTQTRAIKAKQVAVEERIKQAMKKDPSLCNALGENLRDLEHSLPLLPTEPCFFVNDATSEAMARRMAANDGFIGVLSSEGRKVLEIARGKYSGSGADISLWLAGHGYDYYRQDRVNKSSFIIENPCIAALIMTQPDSLRDLAKNESLRESGFLARWLYVVPETLPQKYADATVPRIVAEAYRDAFMNIITTPRCFDYALSPAAYGLWKEAHDQYKAESMKDRNRTNTFIASWLSKFPEHLARLALLLNVLNDSKREQIPESTMAGALELGKLLWEHMHQTNSLMALDDGTTLAYIVWQWLDDNRDRLSSLRQQDNFPANCDLVKPRDLIIYRVAGLTKTDEARAVLEQLHERGYLRRATVNRFAQHRPTECYVLRPQG